jgi:hypothetical protein
MKKEREPMVRKSKIVTMIFLTVCSAVVFAGSIALAGNPGEAGLLSLRMGVGAREAGMGGSGVASSYGASAIFWNPANNVFADFETELVLQHYNYLGLFNQESAAVAHKAGKGVIGFIFSGLYSDSITRYGNEPVAIAEGTYKPYDVSFGLSYARAIGDNVGVGLTAKMIYEKIDMYSDTGFAFDFFVSHRSMIDGLVFGASATNVGGQMNLRAEPFDLPTAFRVGVAYDPAGVFAKKVTLTGDIVFPNDTDEKAHYGAEYRLHPQFVLRAGGKVNYLLHGWTAGAGFRLGKLKLDYSYEDIKLEGFDSGHKFALNLVW